MAWRGVLGFDYGIVQAPLGPDISDPELVAAVANAGGIGLLRAPDWETPDYARELINKTRTLTDKPFGVGVVLAFPHEENIKAILAEKVAVLQVSWGDVREELIHEAHCAWVKVVPQVGSFEEAKKAIDVGVDAIIVQGREAGGHVIGQETPDYLRELINKTRTLTDKPFGVGVVLAFPHKENIKAILAERVAVLQVSWGDVREELIHEAHCAGVKVVPQVGSFEEAKKAIDVGVDAIIVQGREAGGHVIGQDGLMSLLPRVVDLVGDRDIPVIAAGGIVDERGYVASLALGAQGICLGTRFVATEESYAHPIYQRKLLELDETEYTNIFGRARWPGAPHRVLETPFFKEWKSLPAHESEINQPLIGHSTINDMDKEIHCFSGTVPNRTTTGDIESMVMFAGEGVGLIKEILPAAEVVKRLVEGAQLLIHQQLGGLKSKDEVA